MKVLDGIIALYKHEPLIIRGGIVAIGAAAAAFGWRLSGAQIGAVWLVTEAILTAISRYSVYSPATVAKMQRAALIASVPPGELPIVANDSENKP